MENMEGKDILITDDYMVHHKFYFSLTISVAITVITWICLIIGNPIYFYIHNQLKRDEKLWILFSILNVVNNLYQFWAHIFTGTKFMGYNKIVPYGSEDNQTLMTFTMSNIFDILGWITIYISYGYASPFYSILVATHYGSGIVSIFFNQTFQKYYISIPQKTKHKSDKFGYNYWRAFRVSFVFIDAFSRAFAILILFL